MHYFALYQRDFKGTPMPLSFGSHAFVGSVTANDLEEAFINLQAETMCEELAQQLAASLQVKHTSASVGDILVNPDDIGHMVEQIGFRPLRFDSGAA